MNPHLTPTLRRILLPKLPQFIGILILLLVSTGLQTLTPWPFKYLLDNVLGHELLNPSSLPGMLLNSLTPAKASLLVVISYLSLTLISRIFDFLYASYNNYVIQRVTRDFATVCFQQLTLLDYSYLRRHNTGTFLYQMDSNTTAPSELLEDALFPLITSSLYLIISFIVLSRLNLGMATITLVALPLLSISYYLINQRISDTATRLQHKNGLLTTYLDQVITQIKLIQATTSEKFFLMHYHGKIWDNLLTELHLYRYGILLTLSNGVIIGTTYALIISLGTSQVFAGTLTPGLLMVFVFYLDNLVSPVISIIDALSSFRQSSISLNNLIPLFDPLNQQANRGTISSITNQTLTFKSVTLIDNGISLLRDLNLVINPGHLNVITGPSGSGKSSLLHLPLRFYSHWDGDILLGDTLIQSYELGFLRQQIGYVPQETNLFDTTIYEVIRFGYPNATKSDIENSARLACAHDFIVSKPHGYQTKVGELGNLLSGGERQRLLLARTYLRNTPILLLDEILSGQDKDTQTQILKNLRELASTKTVLLISHIQSFLSTHDYVIVIERGHIIRQGYYKKEVRTHAKDRH